MKTESPLVLIAVDDSQASSWALEVGVALARRMNGSITLIHVVLPPTSRMGESALDIDQDVLESIKAAGEAVLASALTRLPSGVRAKAVLRHGETGPTIVDQAREMGAGFVVVGSRGAGRLSHFILGSTAELVIRLSPCPVVTVSHNPSVGRTAATGTSAAGLVERQTGEVGCEARVSP